MEEQKEKKSFSRYVKSVIVLTVISIILNLGNLSTRFCDWYALHIYPIFVATLGRVTAIFPFSVGEYMLMLGIILLLAAIILSISLIFLRKKSGYKKFVVTYLKAFSFVIYGIIIVMTLNCTLVYNCSALNVNGNAGKQYSIDDLEVLRNFIVSNCNSLSTQMQRDDNGDIVYEESITENAKAAMKCLENDYPRMKGYYPIAKPISNSALMSQTYTSGVFFPFSMEANYNNIMYIANYPFVICHEYAHLKGYMLEDECNFFGYLACISYDDEFFNYSGYLNVMDYVNNSYYNSVSPERYWNQEIISDLVWYDDMFLKEEVWEEVEDSAAVSTETVDAVSDSFTDASIKFFGDEDGMASYDRVTELLLEFYAR